MDTSNDRWGFVCEDCDATFTNRAALTYHYLHAEMDGRGHCRITWRDVTNTTKSPCTSLPEPRIR